MMTDDSSRDELHRLGEEFKKLADNSNPTNNIEKTTPDQLAKHGLTLDEAKAWLEQEPNYVPADEFLQRKRADDNLTKPTRLL